MDVPAIGGLSSIGGEHSDSVWIDRDQSLRTLRARWRSTSLAFGWRFPSDWALPEVDAVCAAVLKGAHPEIAMAGLAKARAASGAGLAETLADLAALHAVLATSDAVDGFVVPDVDATPARLVRVTAIAWADAALDHLVNTEVKDPLTGLPTAAYLRTRLGEIYQYASSSDRPPSADYTLLVICLDLSAATGWRRLSSMILTADAVRSVFAAGESIATLGPSSIAVLVARAEGVAAQAVLLRRSMIERIAGDAQLQVTEHPKIRLLRLPNTYEEACEILTRFSLS